MDDTPQAEPARPGHAAGTPRDAVPRKLRQRLTVAIPLVAGFVVMLSTHVLLWIAYPLLFEPGGPTTVAAVERRVTWVFLAGAGLTLLALLGALALAERLARPLRTLVSQMESVRRVTREDGWPGEWSPETASLDRAVEGVASLFSTLARDSLTLRSLESGVVTLDQRGVVTSFNAAAEAVLACPASEAIGHPFRLVVAEEAANAQFLRSVREALAGQGRTSSAEAAVRRRDGRSAQIGYTISPLHSDSGAQVGVVLSLRNLAERKLAQDLVRRAESLAVVGGMATRMAHEIRNPLGAMRGLVELLRDDAAAASQQREDCETILESIDRINQICQELLTIGNPGPRVVEPVDINGLVRESLELCRYDPANKGIEVREDYAADLPRVLGDAERLREVVLNILRNACQAVRAGGGDITLSTRCSGSTVAIAIRNTGPPIPPEVQERLFIPFFTTKTRGTGLGLAMSLQLVRAHGGRILVDSGPEQGTTFTVELPAAGPPSPTTEH